MPTGTVAIASASVSRTVDRAIRRLRGRRRPLRIWIDAVCINQADFAERSQQVSIMGTIYSRAKVVHIWLDEDDPGVGHGAALRMIRDIHNCEQGVCPGGDECACLGTRHTLRLRDLDTFGDGVSYNLMLRVFHRHASSASSLDDMLVIEAAGDKRSDARFFRLMQSLFQHAWFQRVWVLQEATLSQHETFVHCAQEMIQWDELLRVHELLESYQPPHLRGQLRMPAIWNTLSGFRVRTRLTKEPVLGAQTATTEEGDERKPLTILKVLLAALDMKATDPRDKLYALLAFGEETRVTIPPALRPDYTKSLPKVMAGFTRWWIQQYRSLDILSFIHCHPARAWHRTLNNLSAGADLPIPRPTWAMVTEGFSSWSSMTLLEQFPMFHASADTVPDESLLREEPAPLVLRLHGFKLASVIAVSNSPKSLPRLDTGLRAFSTTSTTPHTSHTTPDAPDVFHRMFDTSSDTGLWSYPGTSTKAGEKSDEILPNIWNVIDHAKAHARYSSLTTDTRPLPSPSPAAAAAASPENVGPPPIGEVPWWNDVFLEDPGLLECIDRCFFAADDESHGVCPWTVWEGDVVVLLYGGRIPFVLRPVPLLDQESEGVLQYELVGECFVDRAEVMSGGFMQKRMEMGGWRAEVFALVAMMSAPRMMTVYLNALPLRPLIRGGGHEVAILLDEFVAKASVDSLAKTGQGSPVFGFVANPGVE